MTLFRAVLVPLAALAIGLGFLLGGKVGQVLVIAGTVLAGVACALVLVEG